MDKILITIGGIFITGFIWWFFFGKKSAYAEATDGQGVIEVVVDGGYKPAVIRVRKGVTTTLKIKRSDSNSCLEEIILPDFKIKKYLPLNEEVRIEFRPSKSGEFSFHCGMNMYHGKIIVE